MRQGLTPRYYGWTIVSVGVVCSALAGAGQSFLLALYVDSLIAGTGVSRLGVSTLYGASTLAAALCLPMVGRVADRVPGRRFLSTVLLLLAGALALLAAAQGPLTLALAFFALRLLGQGAIGLGTLTTTVRWFQRLRARALVFVGLGSALGEMTLPALVLLLIGWTGWRGSLLVIATTYAVVFAPLVARLLRDRDEADEPLDGDQPPPSPPDARDVIDSRVTEGVSIPLSSALRMPIFWCALAAVAIMPLVMTGLIFHQVALFAMAGWGASLVPRAFLAFAVSGVVASIGAGFMLDRIPARRGLLAAAVIGLAGLGVLYLPVRPDVAALLYGVLIGAAGATATATNSVLWPDYFGIESLGAVKGVRNGATALGAPLVAALLIEGSPISPVLVLGGCLVAMAALSLLLQVPLHVRRASAVRRRETRNARRLAA